MFFTASGLDIHHLDVPNLTYLREGGKHAPALDNQLMPVPWVEDMEGTLKKAENSSQKRPKKFLNVRW